MPKHKPQLRVAIDCDETLWMNGPYGVDGVSNPRVLALYHALKALNCYIIVWSAGGEAWAREVCEHCGIAPDEIRDKPEFERIEKEVDLAIDDCEDLGIVTLFV